ncbi:MAG TPA: ribbon-helix-helix protein, CopG family [Thermoanaerobaculia bacterium]|jgi:metal-responsive CopG/Arc/MetJ family transcriptional regulator
MKVAISLPDELFEETERLIRKVGKTRSEVYRMALEDYIARHDTGRVREAIDAALRHIEGSDAEFATAAARKILERSEW